MVSGSQDCVCAVCVQEDISHLLEQGSGPVSLLLSGWDVRKRLPSKGAGLIHWPWRFVLGIGAVGVGREWYSLGAAVCGHEQGPWPEPPSFFCDREA